MSGGREAVLAHYNNCEDGSQWNEYELISDAAYDPSLVGISGLYCYWESMFAKMSRQVGGV